jgi:hypothetical protein
LAIFDSSGTLRREPSGLLPEKSSSEMNSKDNPIWLLSAEQVDSNYIETQRLFLALDRNDGDKRFGYYGIF